MAARNPGLMSSTSFAFLSEPTPRTAPAYVGCPLCHEEQVTYEFVATRSAICGCDACGLLFANPPSKNESAATNLPDLVVAGLLRATKLPSGSVALVGADSGTKVPDGYACRRFSSLEELEVGAYDVVLVVHDLPRHPVPQGVLSRVRESLTPAGCVIFTFPSTGASNAIRRSGSWPPFGNGDAFFFDVDTIQLLLVRHGFGSPLTFVDAADLPGAQTEREWFADNAAIVVRAVDDPASIPRLSVIVPVYNERQTVGSVLDQLLNKRIAGVELEIVIVESGSTDGSREIVRSFAGRPNVLLIEQSRAAGKGNAVRQGLKHVTGSVVLFQDADLEYDVDDFDSLVAPLFALRKNFVLGSRHNAVGRAWKIRKFKEGAAISSLTNIGHLAFVTFFNLVNRTALRDPFTMFKVVRRECLYGLHFECDRFDFDFEFTMKLLRKGYRPIELPVNYRSRGFTEGKKVRFFGDPPTWLRALARFRRVPLYPEMQ